MPRTSRTSVRFDVNGQSYLARFGHNHFTPPEALWPNGPKVQHQTTCHLHKAGESSLSGDGESLCSAKDEYMWMRGVKISFQRAVASMIGGEVVVAGIRPLYTDNGEGSRELWGKFMQSFFTEMRIRENI